MLHITSFLHSCWNKSQTKHRMQAQKQNISTGFYYHIILFGFRIFSDVDYILTLIIDLLVKINIFIIMIAFDH